jgi:hypothetical protein
MMAPVPVLAAEDAEDLKVISARLQDAVGRLKDLVYLAKKRRFAAVLNRFKWELPERGREGGNLRVRAGLHFDGVLAVRSRGLRRDAPNMIVSLLAIGFEPKGEDDPAGTISLTFAGGAVIELDVECIDAAIQDMGSVWAARRRQEHEAGS